MYPNGEPVAMKTYGGSAGWYWFVNDHLGTTQKMVDESGSVVWAAAYAPFGEARVYQDEVVNNLRFPGQYYDVETGLHYNWHRYYDPEIGRYLRADPIGLDGGINLFAYVNGNPVNVIDPSGLDPIDPNTGNRSEVMGCHHVQELTANEIAIAMILVDIADIPSGEGIIPGLAVLLGKKTIKYSDEVITLALRYKSLGKGRKALQKLGLRERITRTGRHEFVDSKGKVRVAWDPKNAKGGNHWHKFAPDGKTPLNEAGHVVNKVEPRAHIPSNK